VVAVCFFRCLTESLWVPQTTADKLKAIIQKHGPDSVGVLASAKVTNEENYLAQKFTRAAIGTNNVDHCARL